MLIYIIVGSVREGRTAIKVANWVQQATSELALNNIQTEIVDLKEWDLPIFAGAHPPASGIYDQPKQQAWADKIATADAFILISPEYNHGYSPALKNALDYLGKEWQGKPAAYIGYGSTNGSRSIDQIRQVGTQLGLIDSNATLEIRDIFKRNKEQTFEANEFEVKGLKAMLEKLQKYRSA
ncbi:flavin reductase [Acinetobacter haemolyticus ATCC 19194]|uniref:Flavin reductase n=1 Tax=Acinetobacter haemolyticus ATCC 19194 TaxID=707232 RepID=D4XL21_ACIHA|nr:NAD(P)H-dependent oxidoreductase [Acinetobacter haemolyticus]EFF84103.1 flavin reductase [Acinetobacter haemolyticus ATCC 19194]NAR52078.1 NADPH-dependent oxidoreductase [Acinetobacter haemolyticus]NAR54679.1 NADPH-dependent oxidoreductase [Acinetobacter haemolyticus]QHI24503.1 NADPH-dependent oxidoreductase [Acinetobacter haemolyticus]